MTRSVCEIFWGPGSCPRLQQVSESRGSSEAFQQLQPPSSRCWYWHLRPFTVWIKPIWAGSSPIHWAVFSHTFQSALLGHLKGLYFCATSVPRDSNSGARLFRSGTTIFPPRELRMTSSLMAFQQGLKTDPFRLTFGWRMDVCPLQLWNSAAAWLLPWTNLVPPYDSILCVGFCFV